DLGAVHAVEVDRHRERGHLLLGDDAARVGVDHPVDLGRLEPLPVPLGPDDVDGVERLGRGALALGTVRVARHVLVLGPVLPVRVVAGHGRSSRSSGPKASGSTSLIVLIPRTVSTSRSGPPCSHRSWRPRPHGMSVSPLRSPPANATRRPPPEPTSALTSEHSAHSVTP